MVDFVLPATEMPAKLLSYTQAFRVPHEQVSEISQPAGDLEKILLLVRSQTGHDFSQYKRSTINRRVERRMAVHQIDRLENYLRYLQLTRSEVDALFRDLLIGVTNFFRDPEIFEILQNQVIPKLFAVKADKKAIRIWVPGCSTGEEAYSIAILMREHLEQLKENFKVQVFATDIDREAINRARLGLYPASIIADIAPERLARFFEQEHPDGSVYRINKTIRDMLIFSEHDLIRDPPFSKLDLISCRNLLIYMGHELQKKLMPLFHYALNPGGMLLLGSSESVGDSTDLFATINRKAKIYQRKLSALGPHRAKIVNSFPRLTGNEVKPGASNVGLADLKLPLHEIAQRALLDHYSPVGALVSERGDILYLLGRTGEYLEPTPGV